ncbi:MAG: GNAT family N-acetyltransferase [Actinomycetota bacterium]|nr:GNAT family N-acetyltransferase [Actinomycetota bacterium]
MPWEVRRAVLADADAIAALFARSRAAAMPWLPVLHTPDEDREFFAGEVTNATGWVVEDAGRVLGAAVAREGWLNHLYVDDDCQGRGVGTALLDRVVQDAGPGLRLWAFRQNYRARAFYSARGFVEIDRTDGSGNEERTPDVLLQRG